MKIFGNFFEKNVKFLAIFDIQMAIFRRVSQQVKALQIEQQTIKRMLNMK